MENIRVVNNIGPDALSYPQLEWYFVIFQVSDGWMFDG